MSFYVYMIKTMGSRNNKTYVGYSTNLKIRLDKHNSSKGAKATKGYLWKIIFRSN